MAVPDGFPRLAKGPMAWLPNQVKEEDYVHELSHHDITELEKALMLFKGSNQPKRSVEVLMADTYQISDSMETASVRRISHCRP
jgi:hypothetical protein